MLHLDKEEKKLARILLHFVQTVKHRFEVNSTKLITDTKIKQKVCINCVGVKAEFRTG